jgi:hypothetical protein
MRGVFRIVITGAVLSVPIGARGATKPAEAGGYKGISWGTPCEDAIAKLEATGVEFTTFNSSTVREGFVDHACSGGPLVDGERYIPNVQCSGIDTAITMAFGSGSPYAEATGSAGNVDFSAYCRGGKFIGVQMSVEVSSPESERAARLLKKVAGPAIVTKHGFGTVNSVLKPKGDAARFLTVEGDLVNGSETVRYSVVDSAEWNALRDAYVQCNRGQAENERRQERHSRRQEESAIE